MSALDGIVTYKRREVAALRSRFSYSELEQQAKAASPLRGFRHNLHEQSKSGYGLIAEVKRASPSRGLIRSDFKPSEIARAYSAGGASCLSVLTDKPGFQGDSKFLTEARNSCSLPVLRKDFMIDPLQIVHSRALDADCVLLIMAILGDSQASELETAAILFGMDVLVEVHNQEELERALRLESRLLGINNRNLHTFEVSLDTTLSMMPLVPKGYTVVAESGISSPGDLALLAQAGARCFLVGESLMRATDIEAATRSLIAEPVRAEL